MPNKKDLESLYNSVSGKFDVGTYDEFLSNMNTPEKRKSFYDVVSKKGYDLGDYQEYESRLKKKDDSFVSREDSRYIEQEQQSTSGGFRTVDASKLKSGVVIPAFGYEDEKQYDPEKPSFVKFDPLKYKSEVIAPTFNYDEKKIVEKQLEEKKQREAKREAYTAFASEAEKSLNKMISDAKKSLSEAQEERGGLYSVIPILAPVEQQIDTSDPYERPVRIKEETLAISEGVKRLQNLNQAKDLLKKSKKYLNTTDSGVLESIYKSPLAKDFFTVGLNEVVRNFNVLEIANASKERHLTDDEKMALFAYGLNQAIKGDEDVERTLSSMVGSGVVDMVPYMVQFAMTGGVATGASEATKQFAKSLTKKQINKYVVTAIGELAGAGVRATIMPELYRQIPERMIGEITPEITKEGSFIGELNEETQKDLGESIARSYINTVIEVGVEGMGKYTPKVVNSIGKRFGRDVMTETLTPSTVRQIRSRSGFDDVFSELAGEVVTAYAQAPVEEQRLKDVWDNKQMLSTFLTVAATGGFFSGMELAVNGVDGFKQRVLRDYRNSEQNLDLDKQLKVDKILEKEKIDDIASGLDLLIKEEKSKGTTDEDIRKIIEYAGQKTKLESAVESENIVNKDKQKEAEIKPIDGIVKEEVVEEDKVPKTEEKQPKKEDLEAKKEEQPKIIEYEEERLQKEAEGKKEVIEEKQGKVSPEEVELSEKAETSKALKRILKTGEKTFTRDININQDKAGSITIEEGDNYWSVKRVDVEKDQRMRGIASETYRKMNLDAEKAGVVFRSDIPSKINKESKRIWESLVKKGEAVIKDDGSYEMLNAINKKQKIQPGEVSISTSKTRTTGKNLASSLGKTIETKDITVGGEKVGYIEAGMFDDGNIRMNNVRIEDEKFKGKGVRKESYIQLNKEAQSRGGVLVSSETMSDDAKRVWDSLVKDGIAVKEGQIYKFKEYAKEQQGGQMRFEGEEVGKIEEVIDKDIPSIDRPELQDRPKEKKEEIKERRLGKKALESVDLPDDFKKDLSERGITYAVKGRKVEDREASEIIKAYSESGNIGELKEVIMNKGNDIPGNIRTTLAAKYVQNQLDLAYKEEGSVKEKMIRDAVDVFNSDMIESTTQAQALESKKRWSDVIGRNPDLLIESVKTKAKKENDKKLIQYSNDIQTSQQIIDEFLNSKRFEKIVEDKVGQKFEEYKKERISSVNRVIRGKEKLADAIDRIALLKGVKKNAIDDNAINDDVFKILKDAADGILDIGIGSIESMISKLKVSFREYLKPSEIDKYKDQIVKETQAKERLTKKPTKKLVLAEKELERLVNNLYAKMTRASKSQIKKLARDYVDRVVEIGEMDKESFRDLFASALGLETLTPEIELSLRESAESLNDSRVIGENLKVQWRKYKLKKDKNADVKDLEESIDEQISAYKKSLEKAKFANVAISEMFSDEKSIFELAATFIQGNLLTPVSQLTNIAANATWAPIRGAKNFVATFLDIGLFNIGKLKSRLQDNLNAEKYPYLYRASNLLPDEKRTYDAFAASKGYMPGFKDGFVEALQQMITGYMPDDVYRREISQALHPLKAMVKNIEMMTGKEKANLEKAVRNTLESTIGIPPEIMFRFLNLGDKPFRRATEKARLMEIAKIKGLKGKDVDVFMAMPDTESMEEARQAGLEATYQQDNKISKFINGLGGYSKKDAKENANNIDKMLRGMSHLIVKANIPYVKTPTNIAIETFDYAIAPWSIFQGVQHAIKGDRRKALDYFSRAIVGGVIEGVFATLLTAGIMSLAPAGQEEEEEGKAKVKASEYRNKPSYNINLSAFTRYMNGGDPTWKEDDFVVEYKRFGILSSMAMAKAEAMRGYSVGDVQFGDQNYFMENISGILPVLRSSLDQSFLSGVNSGLTALMKGGYEQDRYLLNLARSFSATAIPNTYVAVNQYRNTYIQEIKDKSLKGVEKNKKEIKNQFKSMLTTENGLPTKITVWGERVTRVPDGRGLGYILFDITKYKNYGGDFGVKIHELYERTRNTDVLPPVVRSIVSYEGNNVSLSPGLEEKYKILIGNNRKLYTESVIESLTWEDLPDVVKVAILEKTYKLADERNTQLRKMFIYENIDEIERLNKLQNEEK